MHADQQRQRIAVDLRLRGDGAHRLDLEPEIRKPGSRSGRAYRRAGLATAIQRNGATQFGPLAARRVLDEGIVAQPRFQRTDLLAHHAVERQLDRAGDIELGAGYRQRHVGDVDLC